MSSERQQNAIQTTSQRGRYFSESMDAGKNPGAIHPVLKCPYGQTGDRIWVRETARSEWQRTLESPFLVQTGVQYRADKEYREITAETKHKMFPAKARTTQGDLAWQRQLVCLDGQAGTCLKYPVPG